MQLLDRIRATAGAIAFRVDAVVPSFLTGDLARRWVDRPGSLVVAAILGLIAASFLALAAENAGLATGRSLVVADVSDDRLPSRERAIISGDLVETWFEWYQDANLDGVADPDEPIVAWSYLLIDPGRRDGLVVLSDRHPATVLHDEAVGVVRLDSRRVDEHLERLGEQLWFRDLELAPAIVIDTTARAEDAVVDYPAGDPPRSGTVVRVTGSRFSSPMAVCAPSSRLAAGGGCPGGRVIGWDRVVVDEVSGVAVVVFQQERPAEIQASLEGLLVARPAEVRSTLDAWPGLEDDYDVDLSRRYVLDEGASIGRPVTIATPLTLSVMAGFVALILVAGRRTGPLTFRPGRTSIATAPPQAPAEATSPAPATSSPDAEDEAVVVRLTGRVRDASRPIRVRDAPAELRIGSDGRARLAAIGRPDRWEATPRTGTIESGLAVLPGGAWPGVRYAGPDGPIVLALATGADPDRLATILASASVRADADARAAQANVRDPAAQREGAARMDSHDLADVRRRLDASGGPYLEFVRSPDLSVGLYVLPPGAEDGQQPHSEDEVYHVVAGRARIVVGDEVRPVGHGAIVFVAAEVPHRFIDVEEELVVLVVFGPAEYARRRDPDGGDVS